MAARLPAAVAALWRVCMPVIMGWDTSSSSITMDHRGVADGEATPHNLARFRRSFVSIARNSLDLCGHDLYGHDLNNPDRNGVLIDSAPMAKLLDFSQNHCQLLGAGSKPPCIDFHKLLYTWFVGNYSTPQTYSQPPVHLVSGSIFQLPGMWEKIPHISPFLTSVPGCARLKVTEWLYRPAGIVVCSRWGPVKVIWPL